MQKVSEQDFRYRNLTSGVKYLMRGPRIDWGVILLLPNETLGGHFHQEVEETFYVIEGRGTFVVNGVEHPAEPGDAFRMEAKDQHDIKNSGQEPLKVIFIKCPFLPADKQAI